MSSSPQPLLLFPCNGNAMEALACLGDAYVAIGFIDDDPTLHGGERHHLPVFGRDALEQHDHAHVLAVPGSPTSYPRRLEIIRDLNIDRQRFATVLSPRASAASLAQLGVNVLLMANVVVTSNAIVEDHVCVLPNTVIHHDVRVSTGCLVGSNVTLAGGVTLERSCYIGSGSSIMNGVTVGAGALVGMGSTIIRDVPAGAVVAGNPGRVLRRYA